MGRGRTITEQTYGEVMTREAPAPRTPFETASRDFVFGEVWRRPGLSRRDRRWVTLTCVGAADSPEPIEEHVYAALNSGDMDVEAMLEFVLHFAVYCGWPKASHLEGVIRRQWARIQDERDEEAGPRPLLGNDTLGPGDWDERIARGVEEFVDVNLIQAPRPETPYTHAGILGFVFGHVWQRPGLTRRERRIITVACVAVCDSPTPLRSHVGAALNSGDVSKKEMDEIVLQFAAYYGFAKGEALGDTADAIWAEREH